MIDNTVKLALFALVDKCIQVKIRIWNTLKKKFVNYSYCYFKIEYVQQKCFKIYLLDCIE